MKPSASLHATPPLPERGSVLVVALIVMAVIALALTSYLKLNLTSARMSQRSYHQAAAFNLAEAGAEEGLWSFNRATAADAQAWQDWDFQGGDARRRFAGFDLGGNASGAVQVYVGNFNAAGAVRPSLVALASVETDGFPKVSKMIEVSLKRRSRFTAGLTARESITFSGQHTSVDSWNSDPDSNAATAAIDYSETVRNDRGIVASMGVENTAVLVNHADIFGYVYTAGPAPQVGTHGTIRGRDTPADVAIDLSRVTTDFSADFPSITAPIDGTPIATIGTTLGTAGEATKWRSNGFSLSGSQTLTILGDVTLVLTAGSGIRALDVTGNASIIIAPDSTLTVYAEGNVSVAGKGIANLNVQASRCLIFGTNSTESGQRIHIAGNGELRAAVYAPNAAVKINGNGNVMGAVVAREITLTGNAAFHFDEALTAEDPNMPFSVSEWRELTTSADRSRHAAKFAGW